MHSTEEAYFCIDPVEIPSEVLVQKNLMTTKES